MYLQGRVTNVYTADAKSELAVDEPLASGSLEVVDAYPFNDTGGNIDLNGTIMAYTSVNYETNTITLAAGSTIAGLAGDDVHVVPYGQAKWVMVDMDDEDEGVRALAGSFTLQLDTGIREPSEQENVLVGDTKGRWEIVAVDEEFPTVPGSSVTPEGLPPAVPSEPPPVSPAVRVSGTTTSLIAETDEVPAGTTIEYHISTVDGFTPTLGGPTKFTETEATVAVIDKLPDGTILDPAGQYYVRTFAFNSLGAAVGGYSAQTPAKLNLANVDELVTAKLVASFIETGKISVGQFTLDAVGMRVNRPGGGYVFNFPFNGTDDLELTAAVTAVTLTIMNNLTINGVGILNGVITAAYGVVAPTQAPGVTRQWPHITTTLGDGNSDLTEVYHGLIQHPSSTTELITAMNFFGTTFIRRFLKLNGAWAGDLTLGSWKNTFSPNGGITHVGGFYFIMGMDNSRSSKWYIYKIDPATGNKTAEVEVADWTFFNGAYPRLFTDGTSVMYMFVNASKNLRIVTHSQSLGAGTGQNILGPLTTRYNIGDVHVGSHDGIGATRAWVSFRASQEVWCFTPGPWTQDPTYDFERPSSVSGMTYDTTNGQMLTLSTTGLLYRHGKYAVDKSIQAKYGWLDATPTTHETEPGPVKTYTLPARSYLSLQAEPPPDIDNTDPLNTDKANQVAMYASDDAGATWKKIIYTTDPWGSDHPTLVGLTAGTPKVTNEFLTSTVATPGRLKSFKTDSLLGASAPTWDFEGNGEGRMGQYTTARHYGSRTRSTTQSIPNNTLTQLVTNVTKSATVGLTWDGSTFSYIAGKAGVYLFMANISWDSHATGRRTIQIRKNGTAWGVVDHTPGAGTFNQAFQCMIPLDVGDSVDCYLLQNSGVSLTVGGTDDSRLYFDGCFLAP